MKSKLIKYYWVCIMCVVDCIKSDFDIPRHILKFKVHKDIQELFFPTIKVKKRVGRTMSYVTEPCPLIDLEKVELLDIIFRLHLFTIIHFNLIIPDSKK